jgi:peptidoglycan/LPS O-acetylase OafA/YrhL
MRAVLAVVTGYVTFALSAALLFQLTQHDPHANQTVFFGVASVIWGILFATLGGLLAARLAQNLLSSVIVGCLIATGAIVSLAFEAGHGAIWSQLSALLLMAPSAWLGGLLQQRRSRTTSKPD